MDEQHAKHEPNIVVGGKLPRPHGERVRFCVTFDWVAQCLTEKGGFGRLLAALSTIDKKRYQQLNWRP
jgi:hypothetical protein